jgi:hypothetical protein
MALLVNEAFRKKFIGESTETKPTLETYNAGSTFYERDTKDFYLWYGAGWELM